METFCLYRTLKLLRGKLHLSRTNRGHAHPWAMGCHCVRQQQNTHAPFFLTAKVRPIANSLLFPRHKHISWSNIFDPTYLACHPIRKSVRMPVWQRHLSASQGIWDVRVWTLCMSFCTVKYSCMLLKLRRLQKIEIWQQQHGQAQNIRTVVGRGLGGWLWYTRESLHAWSKVVS